jgi:hypothetical protein
MEIFVFLFDFLICQNEAMVKQMGVFGLLDSMLPVLCTDCSSSSSKWKSSSI